MSGDPAPQPRRSGLVLLTVSAATFLASLDLFIVNIAFPQIRTVFPDTDLGAMSWVLNSYTVVFAAFLSPAGRISDRFGHKAVFLTGLAVFTTASAACGLAGSFVALVVARAVQALGAAMLMPTSLALAMAAVPAARRAFAVSTWSAVGAMAATLGPPVGGLLVEISWRWVFFVNIPIGLLALAVGAWVLPKSPARATALPDVWGAAGLVISVGAAVWALIEAPERSWTHPPVLVAFAVAVVAGLAVVRRSMRHPSPALDLAALRVGAVWSSCVALLLFSAAFSAMLFGNVLFLTGVWNQSPSVAGMFLAPGPVAVVVVSFLVSGRLIRRFGVGTVAATGCAIFALGVGVWLWRVGLDPAYAVTFLPGQVLTGVGVGLVIPALSSVVGETLPQSRWGAGSAMVNTARQVGMVLGTALITLLHQPVSDLAGVRHGWLVVVCATITALLASLLVKFHLGRRSADDSVETAAVS